MKKNPPSMREVNAAEQALREKIREKAKCCGTEPTYEANRAWEKANPSPSERYARKVRAFETALRTKADELLLAGRMGQITSEEFYAKVKAF
jgi:hypothetical protein